MESILDMVNVSISSALENGNLRIIEKIKEEVKNGKNEI